ncbi:MAG: methyl-accepting chemotaxis protein [Rhodocyclaceae bacterium]|nr:methyl-accepting chemotaxis protein [Rhodocyclaceae bacterium]
MLTPRTIRGKLLCVLLLSIIGFLVVTAIALVTERSTLMLDRETKTRHLVEAATTLVAHYHDLQNKGQLTEADAKTAAIEALRAMRYEKSEYFWVNDMTPTMVMHPFKPELEGKSLADFKDPSGLAVFVEFAETVKRDGAGFVHYLWPKPGFDQPVPKVSYVSGFQPWGWVIGSGIYLDDVNSIFRERAIELIATVLAGSLLITTMLMLLIRSISRPIDEIRKVMRSIGETQDLSRRVDTRNRDEIAEIGRAFNDMVGSFQDLIRRVMDSAHEVMELSSRVAASAHHVALSSDEQNQASGSMAAAIEETKASIEQVASNSSDAHQIAERAGSLAQQGEEIVANAAGEMSRIAVAVTSSAQRIETLGEMSNQIVSIVNVIREIADQTNLLALNAAIEAARAGEQGRGFAVVADEVRKLAERTAQSTLEIGRTIEGIRSGTLEAVNSMHEGSARVQGGVTLTEKAGKSMAEIRVGAGQVIAAVSDIALAMQEQSAATNLVVENVDRIVTMAERNNADTNEIAQNAEQLEKLAGSLTRMVDQFKV